MKAAPTNTFIWPHLPWPGSWEAYSLRIHRAYKKKKKTKETNKQITIISSQRVRARKGTRLKQQSSVFFPLQLSAMWEIKDISWVRGRHNCTKITTMRCSYHSVSHYACVRQYTWAINSFTSISLPPLQSQGNKPVPRVTPFCNTYEQLTVFLVSIGSKSTVGRIYTITTQWH